MKERPVSMTVEEADRIDAQYSQGRLDVGLPGTMEIVDEARRVRLQTYLWGAPKTDPSRKKIRVAAILGAIWLLGTVLGLLVPLSIAFLN